MVSLIDSIYDTIINEMSKYINDEYFESFIVIEGISYGSSIRTKSVFDLAGLNYLIRYKLIKAFDHSKFTIVPPSELKKFTTGKGNANKDTIVALFQLLYPDLSIPKLDDIADAYFMSNYAKHMDDFNEI
jgi:Holliday junction resolvasome RuvABC endonuclease subunit